MQSNRSTVSMSRFPYLSQTSLINKVCFPVKAYVSGNIHRMLVPLKGTNLYEQASKLSKFADIFDQTTLINLRQTF